MKALPFPHNTSLPPGLVISGEPLLPGEWSSFRNFVPYVAEPHQLIWKQSMLLRGFLLGFATLLSLFTIASILHVLYNWPDFQMLAVSVFAGILAILIWDVFITNREKIVIDKKLGVYYFNNRVPLAVETSDVIDYPKIKDVCAIQILRTTRRINLSRTRGNDTSINRAPRRYDVYELNFVLKNGERENIMCHGNLEAMREDVKRIITFIPVPVVEG